MPARAMTVLLPALALAAGLLGALDVAAEPEPVAAPAEGEAPEAVAAPAPPASPLSLLPLAPPAPGSPLPAPLAPAVEPAPSWDRTPATEAAGRLASRLRAVLLAQRESRYVHFTQVDEARGSYLWDCSGMVGWALRREARRAYDALEDPRPVARDFARLFSRSSTRYARRGWRRVLRVADARAGDVFAWQREEGFLVTGHVGVVAAAPVPAPGEPGTLLVRVLDATTTPHDDDTRARAGDADGGLGEGTLALRTDDLGRGVAYGWEGARSTAFVPVRAFVGRLE